MSNDSDSDGVALGGVCPSSLTVAQTEDLTRFGLCVSPSAKLPRPWRIFADGHPTLGPPASREELRKHPSGRYDRRVARGVPAGNIPWEAGPCRRRAAAPAAAAPPASPEVPLPPKQATLHQDGDPADTPGLLVALAQSTEEAARAAAEEALDEVQAVMAVQQVVALETAAEEDEWLLSSSDDDSDGDDDVGDGGGNAAVIDLTEED
ncbi:hypothetical protein D1007_55687 [Hordeum vulgare]|nr:hypothetical protein D1007_55687 [Hordeum vulgare]